MPIRRFFLSVCAVFALVTAEAAAEPMRLLAFGDSLTQGYGTAPGTEFPAILERALKEKGHDVVVINGGVSGDTAAGGASRVGWSLADQPHAVIVELGANDALRGLDPVQTERHLDDIITQFQAEGIKVLLAGMLAPPNLGVEYGKAFNGLYPRLAAKHDVPLYPFFLDGVAADPSLNQPDGIHPNAAGVEVIVERILPAVEALLADAKPQTAG